MLYYIDNNAQLTFLLPFFVFFIIFFFFYVFFLLLNRFLSLFTSSFHFCYSNVTVSNPHEKQCVSGQVKLVSCIIFHPLLFSYPSQHLLFFYFFIFFSCLCFCFIIIIPFLPFLFPHHIFLSFFFVINHLDFLVALSGGKGPMMYRKIIVQTRRYRADTE